MFNIILSAMTETELKKVVNPVLEICEVLVPVLLAVVGSLGAIWCILLGVKYAKAEDPQEHEKAKKSLINSIVGYVLIFILIVMLEVATKLFTTWYTGYQY